MKPQTGFAGSGFPKQSVTEKWGTALKQGYRLICMALGLFLLLAGTGCSAAPEAVEAGGILWFCQPASGGTLCVEPAYDSLGDTGRIFRSDLSGKVIVPEEIDGKPVTELADRAFFESEETTEIVLGEEIRTIGKECFYGCTALRTAELPASVRELGENAFSKSGIERLSFPESLRTIGREDSLPFYGCQSLKEILVDPENLYYFSEGGVLFSKKKKTLLCYPAAKQGSSYVIPDTVEKLAPGSFWMCTNLETLTIPASVRKMECRFADCHALKMLMVPEDRLEDDQEHPALEGFTGKLEGYTR